MLFAPPQILVHKYLFGAFTDAIAVPELGHEVHPLFAPICTGGSVKQTIRVRESGIQQGNQIVFLHGLYLASLSVLLVTVLQQQSGIILWKASWQSKPAVKTVVRQLYCVFSVDLDTPQFVVPVAMCFALTTETCKPPAHGNFLWPL